MATGQKAKTFCSTLGGGPVGEFLSGLSASGNVPTYAYGAGAGISAIGSVAQGIAASKVSKYNRSVVRMNSEAQANAAEAAASISERNAVLAEQDAELARQAAIFREQQLRLAGRRAQSEIALAYAASGVTMAGSPLETMAENAYQLETEALMTRYAGELEARARGEEAVQHRYQALASQYEGKSILTAGKGQRRLLEYQGSQAFVSSLGQGLGDLSTGAMNIYGAQARK